MKTKFLSAITAISIIISVIMPFSVVHADSWILASNLPQGAEVTARKWTYTLTSYTTSSSSSLSGWERYKSTWVWGPWGNWSGWKDSEKTASDSRQVEKRNRYNYYRWSSSYNGSTGSYEKNKNKGWTNLYTYAIGDKLSSNGSGGYKLYHNSNGDYDSNGKSYHSVWKRDPFKTTQYKYRDRKKVYTYYYRKSENKESSSYPSGNNISNITEWVTYRLKTFPLDLNAVLNNEYNYDLKNFGTVDVYINGVLAADDVNDYYGVHTYGTRYEITDIKNKAGQTYDGVYSGSLSGEITGDTYVILRFYTNSHIQNVISEDESKGTVTGGGTYIYGTNMEINAIPKPGYDFSQWSNGVTSAYQSVPVYGDATYIAYFSPKTFNVTFDSTTGEADITNKTVTYNELYGELPLPKKSGYNFDGWFTSAIGGVKINADSKVTLTEDHTLYAQWSEAEHRYSEWIVDKEPSCTEIGLQHRTCGECGFTEQSNIPMTEHEYSIEWNIIEKPSCTKEGKKAHVCSVCGGNKDVTLIEKTEHNYQEWQTVNKADCTNSGKKQRICSDCNNTETADIPPLGHNYSEDWKVVTAPTCTKEGEKAHVCSLCGDEKDVTKTEKAEHSYGDWILLMKPECTESGFEYRNCSVCGQLNTRRIKALGHQYEDNWTITKEATCTSTGEKVHTCTLCGNKSDVTIIERKDHDYSEWTTEKATTCTDEGLEIKTCNTCGKKEQKIVGATGHEFVVDHVISEPTISEKGERLMICKNGCGTKFNEKFYPEVHQGNLVISQVGEIVDNEVTVSVVMKDNPGFSNFALSLIYDKYVFIPEHITKGELLNGGTFSSNLIPLEEKKIDLDDLMNVSATYVTGLANNKDITDKEVELFRVTFKINTGVPSGDYKIAATYTGINEFVSAEGIKTSLGINDSKYNQIMPQISDAVFKLEFQNIRGDVNQDQKVDILDSIYLGCYMAGWQNLPWTDAHQQAADVFADGRINPKDGSRLAQILSGYDIDKPEISTMSVDDTDDGISLFSVDKDYTNLYVGNVTGAAGTEIDVPVVIKGNVGFSGFNFKLNYDNKYLTPVSVINGTMYEENYITNIQQDDVDISKLDHVNICWLNEKNVYGDGVLFTVRFLINKNVSNGQVIPVTLSYDDGALCRIKNSDFEDVDIFVKQGSVETVIDTSVFIYPYDISEIVMTSYDGNELQSIPKNGDFILSVRLSTLKECSDLSTVYAAEYNEQGKLIAVNSQEVTEKMLNGDFGNIHIDECSDEISYIKIFVWNAHTMMPLAESYNLK